MASNKYKRDFYDYGALKRPGRIDRTLFEDIPDCGDGFGGIQWMILKSFGTQLFPRFVIEGCAYDGVDTLSHGYIMWNGEPIQVAQQTIVVANGEWLYINENGVAHVTGVESTAQDGIVIYERDGVGNGFDVRFALLNNVLKGLSALFQDLVVNQDLTVTGDVDIDGDLDVDGTTNLDDVDITGGTSIHAPVNMNAQQINAVANPTAAQDAVTLAYLKNYLPIGTILMYKGVGWTDNTTIVGWYECTALNAAHGVPDLIDKFIRASATSGAGGGADSVTLALNQIPTHTSGNESVVHTHTNDSTTATQSASHTHNVTMLPTGEHQHGLDLRRTNTNLVDGSSKVPQTGGNTLSTTLGDGAHTHTINLGIQSASHHHVITIANSTTHHTHTFTSPGGQIAVPTVPVYYKLRFIMRCV